MRSFVSCALLAVLPACGPGDEVTTAETAGTTEVAASAQPTSTDDAGTQNSSSGETGSDTEACGPAPAPFACAPDDDGGLVTLICAARSQADCDGPIDNTTSGECRWQQTLVYAHDAATCEAPEVGGACIAFINFGDPCQTAACGDGQGTVYYRTDANCQTHVFRHTRCGEGLVDWNPCAWDTSAGDACTLPNPSAGPALCKCAC